MRQWAGRRVLVTGVKGFLGANVVAKLLRLGTQVYGVARAPLSQGSAHVLVGDLTDPEFVRRTFQEVKPDIVFHLAGQTNASTDRSLILPTFQGNLVTTVNVLSASTDSDCSRVILTGSLEEPEVGWGEAIPSSPYALSKWGTVLYGRAFQKIYRAPVVIVRPFMTYGPRQRPNKLVPYLTLSLLQGKTPIIKSAERCVDWVFVDDVVEGILAAAVTAGVEGQTIDLGTGVATSVREVATRLASIIGETAEIRFDESSEAPSNTNRVADVAQAERWLEWKPKTSLQEGLAHTVQWYRAESVQAADISILAQGGRGI
jgi:nucleoside-diphosphate-sugar epimerase